MTKFNREEMAFKDFAVGMMLIGVAISRNGDGSRVRQTLAPELLEGYLPQTGMKALVESDSAAMKKFLARCGVQLMEGERVVDALMREHLSDARQRLSDRLERVTKAEQMETERLSKENEQ